MKKLVATLASLALIGCGGPDETTAQGPAQESAQEGALERPPVIEELEAVLPSPEEQALLEVIWARGGDALRLAQDVVEERFFFPVDVTMPPPELPPPPCPSCR